MGIRSSEAGIRSAEIGIGVVLSDGPETLDLETRFPDGVFSKQKIPIWVTLESLRFEKVNTFYGHLEYFREIWDILERFGIF
jgi:hypothetical protein